MDFWKFLAPARIRESTIQIADNLVICGFSWVSILEGQITQNKSKDNHHAQRKPPKGKKTAQSPSPFSSQCLKPHLPDVFSSKCPLLTTTPWDQNLGTFPQTASNLYHFILVMDQLTCQVPTGSSEICVCIYIMCVCGCVSKLWIFLKRYKKWHVSYQTNWIWESPIFECPCMNTFSATSYLKKLDDYCISFSAMCFFFRSPWDQNSSPRLWLQGEFKVRPFFPWMRIIKCWGSVVFLGTHSCISWIFCGKKKCNHLYSTTKYLS